MKGNNWRIRNITLGYTLPAELAGRVGASTARLYATANEPYIHFKYDYFDPETFIVAPRTGRCRSADIILGRYPED
jgi:hypothetical protein